MTAKETLDQVVDTLSEERVREVLDFARFLRWQEECEEWRQFGQAQLARAYGPDEPEYADADIKPELSS